MQLSFRGDNGSLLTTGDPCFHSHQPLQGFSQIMSAKWRTETHNFTGKEEQGLISLVVCMRKNEWHTWERPLARTLHSSSLLFASLYKLQCSQLCILQTVVLIILLSGFTNVEKLVSCDAWLKCSLVYYYNGVTNYVWNQIKLDNSRHSCFWHSFPTCNCESDSWNVSDNPQTKLCSENTDG